MPPFHPEEGSLFFKKKRLIDPIPILPNCQNQAFCGSSQLIVIKYQIMIMLTIFVGTILSVYLSILFSTKMVFDRRNMLSESILKRA